tara:strand:- start:416 stop:565 length:150 start_codon:yes stop_codon:yes gene_type:complete
MARAKRPSRDRKQNKKKTSQGSGKFTKWKRPGPNGGNKKYRKRYRGQGR